MVTGECRGFVSMYGADGQLQAHVVCKGFEELEISMACIAFSLCYEVNCTDLVKGW